MKFEHLTDSDFEELTYDLLAALGFVNLSWRRGSGRGGASADQGRDIVAQEMRKGPDGGEHFETWFVQCKHYVRGVPPEKLDGALTWSAAERPDVLLFAVSNFLSNPAKAYLDKWEQNNRPPFRLRIWERKDFEQLLSSHPSLIRTYQLDPGDPAGTAHPAHLRYVLRPPLNTLDYFFRLLDSTDGSMRDEVFGLVYHAIIGPRYRKPRHRKETIGELQLDVTNYSAFQTKCREVANNPVAESFLVQAIVSDVLGHVWQFCDPEHVNAAMSRNEETIVHFTEELRTETDTEKIEAIRGIIAIATSVVEAAPERQRTWRRYYDTLCANLLPALALEQPELHTQ